MFRRLIRKTPLIHVWRKIIKQVEYRRIMKINYEYRRYIAPLMNEKKLESCICNLKNVGGKTYYVIALQNERVGIFGYIDNILPHIAYAIAKGYIPVIDMKNYPSLYQKQDENAWEKFFEQPCETGLDDMDDGKVLFAPTDFWYRWEPNSCPLMSDDEIRMWGRIYEEYVRYNSETKKYLAKEMSKILKDPHKTLGVIYRGTDYTQGHPIGHPIQPSMEKLADKAAELLERQNCEYIYLASEEKGIVDYMNHRFPGKVLINQRVYYDEVINVDYSNYNTDHIGVSGAVFDREDNEYLIGIEYISSMNLVANCACIVAGACGGTTAVLYMNQLKYKEKYIFNLGKYGVNQILDE